MLLSEKEVCLELNGTPRWRPDLLVVCSKRIFIIDVAVALEVKDSDRIIERSREKLTKYSGSDLRLAVRERYASRDITAVVVVPVVVGARGSFHRLDKYPNDVRHALRVFNTDIGLDFEKVLRACAMTAQEGSLMVVDDFLRGSSTV